MARSGQLAALFMVLAWGSQAKTNLRPLKARHHLIAQIAASVKPSKIRAPTAMQPQFASPLPSEPQQQRTVSNQGDSDSPMIRPPVPAAMATAASPKSEPAALTQLNDDLTEVRQMRKNVGAVEKALAADIALLRESVALQRVSKSPPAHKAAQKQVQAVEALVRDTEALVKTSRQNAVNMARDAMREATEVQKAADALSAEATTELKRTAPEVEVKATRPPKLMEKVAMAPGEEVKATKPTKLKQAAATAPVKAAMVNNPTKSRETNETASQKTIKATKPQASKPAKLSELVVAPTMPPPNNDADEEDAGPNTDDVAQMD